MIILFLIHMSALMNLTVFILTIVSTIYYSFSLSFGFKNVLFRQKASRPSPRTDSRITAVLYIT